MLTNSEKNGKRKAGGIGIGIAIGMVVLLLCGGLLWFASHRNKQTIKESEKYSRETEKEMKREAEQLELLIPDYEEAGKQIATLPQNTPEYAKAESDLAEVIRKILTIRPSFVEKYDSQGNPVCEPIENVKNWVEQWK